VCVRVCLGFESRYGMTPTRGRRSLDCDGVSLHTTQHTRNCSRAHTCTHARTHTRTHARAHTHIHAHTHTRMYARTCARTHTCACTQHLSTHPCRLRSRWPNSLTSACGCCARRACCSAWPPQRPLLYPPPLISRPSSEDAMPLCMRAPPSRLRNSMEMTHSLSRARVRLARGRLQL